MKTWAFIGILLAILVGGAYFYYNTSQNRIEALLNSNATLVSNNSILADVNAQNISTIDDLQQEFLVLREVFEEAINEFQIIRENNNELRGRFSSNDLEALALQRPVTVQRIINDASSDALRCFELLTDAPLTTIERNATTANEFNSECPWLWEGGTSN